MQLNSPFLAASRKASSFCLIFSALHNEKPLNKSTIVHQIISNIELISKQKFLLLFYLRYVNTIKTQRRSSSIKYPQNTNRFDAINSNGCEHILRRNHSLVLTFLDQKTKVVFFNYSLFRSSVLNHKEYGILCTKQKQNPNSLYELLYRRQ